MPIDYRSFSPNGAANDATLNPRWWKESGEDLASAVAGVITYLNQAQTSRITNIYQNLAMYGNLSMMGVNGLSYSKMRAVQRPVKERLTLNVVQAAIDTVTSKIAKNKPKPLFLTSGGMYVQQKKAENLDKFTDGIFYENEAYSQGQEIFRDGAVVGTGCTHVYEEFDRVKHERVLTNELFVDEVEAAYGHPKQLHRVKTVDRDSLAELFPDKSSIIIRTNSASYDMVGSVQNVSDVVTVRESWRLPSGPKATDGCHAITLDNGTLLKEQWDKPYFPFANFHWNKRMVGYWGQGLAEILAPLQAEINKILWVLQRSYHLAGSFKILISNGSKIVKEHLNNDIGAIIAYTGEKPDYIVPPIVPPEIYAHLNDLVQKAFFESGVSMLSAGSQKPAGLNSGKALREYNDIESDRFMVVGQAYERYYLDLAKLSIGVAKDIYSRNKKYRVFVPFKKAAMDIDWKDVDLTEDEYVMKAYPVSSLPEDPEGRLQTVQEYMQAGLMSPKVGRRLLDFPDVEQVEKVENAPAEYLDSLLEKIIDEGILTLPEPYDDLADARPTALNYYAWAKLNGVEEEKLDLIRQFIDYLDVLAAKAMPPQPQLPMPQAAPETQPTSPMIQNVPGVQ